MKRSSFCEHSGEAYDKERDQNVAIKRVRALEAEGFEKSFSRVLLTLPSKLCLFQYFYSKCGESGRSNTCLTTWLTASESCGKRP